MIKKTWKWLVADDFKCPNLPDPLPLISWRTGITDFITAALCFASPFLMWVLLAEWF